MSILSEGERGRVAQELLKHKEEIARIANNVINDIIIRKSSLEDLRKHMVDNPNIFSASDIADVDAIMVEVVEKVQEVYDIVTN